MNAFSKIDMREVTRLTRAGKIAEAMALLQGRTASGVSNGSRSSAPGSTKAIKRQSPPIDMVVPSLPGGAGRLRSVQVWPAAGKPIEAADLPDLADTMGALRRATRAGLILRRR